ncbi:phage tail tube protein [Deinococcus ruber]|uniref:Uncharacterized protein n=1 Tax=Deinococcus ruber TaxID=1848197 RepID=A0A918F7M9_9DEIO|nr:phage tail tube protein [Deinococcus ruber]GGR16794.1 hypothetical protein GCM10008957_31790 [Deinococcus ruber]
MPAFVPNTAAVNDGRFGWLALALQTAPNTFVPPTVFLRENGGSGVKPDYLERMDDYFALSRFEAPALAAGYDIKMTWSGELAPAEYSFLMQAIFGAAVTGTITPSSATQWAPYLPLPAICGQWFVPTQGLLQFLDAQLYDLTITIPSDRTKNATYTATAQACTGTFVKIGDTDPGVTPVTPVVPAYGQGLFNGSGVITIGGTAVIPDGDVTIKFMNPVDPLPAVGLTIPGFAPSTNPISMELSTKFNGNQNVILEASRGKGFLTVVYTLNGKAITMNAQVTAFAPPIGPGRVVTDATFRARSATPGAAPFTVAI